MVSFIEGITCSYRCGDEFLKYRSLTTAVSKEDDIEDIEKKFACWLKEK